MWYLLKNHRYEGPFELEDLNVRAQQGQLSPDDYVIDETNFNKGQMVYRRAAEILAREVFALSLSVPEAGDIRPTASAVLPRPDTAPSAQLAHESYRPASVSRTTFQESVSPLRDLISSMSFANVAVPCLVVLSAVWVFQNGENSATRQPAEIADQEIKPQVTREIVRDESRNRRDAAPVERLMPSERPSSRIVERKAPPPEGPVSEKLQERLSERSLASETAPEVERVDPRDIDASPGFPEERPQTLEGEEAPPPFEDEGFPQGDGDTLIDPAVLDVPEGEAY